MKITHVWTERNDNTPPSTPSGALFPKDGETLAPIDGENIATLAPLFKWKSSGDPDKKDEIVNYNILISFDPQCRWPIASALHKETDSGDSEWQLPEGWLNEDTSYFWKVRAQDSRGVWGEWSEVYRFKTSN